MENTVNKIVFDESFKNGIIQRIDAVAKALDGINVAGIKNATSLVGCYQILNETIGMLSQCNVATPMLKEE